MWDKYKHIIPHISIGSGVIDTVADWVRSIGCKSVLAVCDPITKRVAGDYVIASLRAAGISVTSCVFSENEPLPSEYSVGYILSKHSPGIDLILGVGSGTINDLCTFVGAKVGCNTAIVATAPSMDGYASLGSAMLFDGVKVTPSTICAFAIFCDTLILSAAPMNMIAAGLGDMLGKITSLADWRLSHILTGEEIDKDIYGIMEDAANKIIKAAPLVTSRDIEAISRVTEGLVLSGIAMSLFGDSRPASGTEHHLAHFWEMRMLAQGKSPALHGIKVGLATVIALVICKELAACDGDIIFDKLLDKSADDAKPEDLNAANFKQYEEDICRLYGKTAETILQTQNPNLPLSHIKKHWPLILDVLRSLPPPESIAHMLAAAGMDMQPASMGLDEQTLRDSLIYARDRKKTYTVLQLLGDLGLADKYADIVCNYFAKTALFGVKCFVLDMDGTIYLGDRLFPYTLDFLKRLTDNGFDYVFFTNNSSQNAAHYIAKLRKMGISIEDGKLLMSTFVLLDFLGKKYAGREKIGVFVAGTKALMDDFIKAGYTLTDDAPEFAVLGFDTDMDYGRLTKLCDFARSGVPVYGVNMDYNCPVPDGFIPDCGSLGAAVTASSGIDIEYFGKPSRRALDYIIQETGYREDELCFVGDRLYTDIAITQGTKARSVLVLSGETKREDLSGSPYVPNIIADDLQDLQL
ncbi:MAG: iron-containing alcohol dehydrogenase [Oscillospiraceae bacterium]|nr:iron-containing alcohol dehydrogenase [Oscillospiraceae bacterium]